MGYILVIVESPAKCKKIEGYLGSPYKCIASFGHIRQFKNGLKSIDKQNNYTPSFKFLDSKHRYIQNLSDKIKRADDIILATDDDREGEAIAWHICDAFGLSMTTKRIIFHEITKKAIVKAVQQPTTMDMNKIYAQRARQILDIIVGFTLSPVLWNQIGRTMGLSAGRCQTPALRIVYENQKEIDQSPGKESYNTVGVFTDKELPFALNHSFNKKEKMEEFLEDSVSHDHAYSCSKPREAVKKQPKPFTTSGLQQMSSNELHYSPKRTMQMAQKLYEGGYITYMRTDSLTYSAVFIDLAKKFIAATYGEEYVHDKIDELSLRKKKKKKKDSAQEAHEAIRPTAITRRKLPNGVEGGRLYYLIWRNTVESCMVSAVYWSITGSISAPSGYKYNSKMELVMMPGWKIVNGYEKVNPLYDYLLGLKKKTIMNYSRIDSTFTLKELKMHYTEARLVHLLEKRGIGRPSTFSSLIAKIQERNYVKIESVQGKKIKGSDYALIGEELEEIETSKVVGNERNKLVIQPMGKLVIEFLLKHFGPFFEYSYTKNMEDSLDLIAKGKRVWYSLCEQCDKQLGDMVRILPKKTSSSVKIDDMHTYVIGKYGPVIKYKNGEETKFLSVKKDLDMEKLKKGEYELSDIVEVNKDDNLGTYKGDEVILKKGKYGKYLVIGANKISLKSYKGEITLEGVMPYLTGEKNSNPNVLRVINKQVSVRKGKWGKYIYSKKEGQKKPNFISLKGCELNVMTCDKGGLLEWVLDHLP